MLVYQLIAEPLLTVVLPGVMRWMPFVGAAAGFGGEGDPELFSRPVAAVLMLVYVVAAWAPAAWFERSRDV